MRFELHLVFFEWGIWSSCKGLFSAVFVEEAQWIPSTGGGDRRESLTQCGCRCFVYLRAHRIGQQREVHVWSLVSEWTVEERMAFRREQKLRLDKLLVQQQKEAEAEAEALDGEEADDMKEHRSEKISTDEVRKLMLHGKKAIVVR